MVIMEQDSDAIRSLPLSSLPRSTRQILSDLLNTTKVIPTEGPDVLYRDWRGLAALANITSEVVSGIYSHPDKTARVLELWTRDPRATVGRLLDCLQVLDRHDVHEDICVDLTDHSTKRDLRIETQAPRSQSPTLYDDSEIITLDDRPGYIHKYDAYLLYADADIDFIEEMKYVLRENGFKICTKERIMPGHATEFAPISKVISERCQRIILVYSPDFLSSPANNFYRDLAQAISIERRTNMTIPIMYKQCELPQHTALYFMLRYTTSRLYNFWDKLVESLRIATMPRVLQNGHSIQSAHSAFNIVELSNTEPLYLQPSPDRLSGNRSVSVEIVPTTSSPEGSIISETSQGVKKKYNFLKSVYKKVKGKKTH